MLRMLSGMVLLLFLFGFVHSATGAEWVEHTGTCYWLHDKSSTFAMANTTCMALEGALVELETYGKYLAVLEILSGDTVEAWVNMKLSSGTLTWATTGQQAPTSMWIPGEPNQTGDCVRLVQTYGGVVGPYRLADNPCNNNYHPFCERPASLASSISRRLSTLPQYLCRTSYFVTSGLLECAQTCAKCTSCYIYSFHYASKECSFHRLMENCSDTSVIETGTAFYRMSRACS